ncbi:MAG: transporter substrate-binding domain-containing protein [Chromatiales bacterium]|nr:transporter substrate-binding domain-containing protein [Chromatiales bacterium]
MLTQFRRTRGIAFAAAIAVSLGFSSGSANADLLAEIKKRGEFIVGTEARFPPFEFVDDGEIVGYSTDIMAHVMQALPGVQLTRLDLPWQGILPGLAAAKFDYVVTSVTVTKERYEKYALSLPIADATMALVKRKGDDSIMAPEDIAGHTVGSQAGSAQLQALEAFAKGLSGEGVEEIKTYVDFNEAFADLAAGRISAVCNSLPNLLELVRTRPDAFELVLPTFGPKKYFSWAGRKDEDSATLVAFIDEQLAALNRSGVLTELQEKWFGGPMELPSDELPMPAN